MAEAFKYISNGRMYEYCDGGVRELGSGILESYKTKIKDSAERNEWKYTGTGAAFTGTFRPGASADDAVMAVWSSVSCVGEHRGDLIYALDIDNTNGIYRKPKDSKEEGIVLCSSNIAYRDFDIRGDMMAVSSSFAGESNIGVMNLVSKKTLTYTEGHTLDITPVWSRVSTDKIYFCSIGLAESNMPRREDYSTPMGRAQMLSNVYAGIESAAARGPAAICLLDVLRGTLEDVLADGKYDYTHPASTRDGSLYYIRKPYGQSSGSGGLGCLVDIVMFPVRLVGAFLGFLNVFSAKYSGKTLSRSDVKSRDEKQLFIDGNLINAERELKKNAKRGEKHPGIIPRSWELRRLSANGEDTLVRAGVTAFRVDDATGDILFSNGSAIIKRDKDGKEEKILSADGVTFIV